MADVVCAQKFFRRNGAKPILQVTVPLEYNQARVQSHKRLEMDPAKNN
jgi:hypothetical protein